MTLFTSLFRRTGILPEHRPAYDRAKLAHARKAAQQAHNAALAAGDTRRQKDTRKALYDATCACLKAGV